MSINLAIRTSHNALPFLESYSDWYLPGIISLSLMWANLHNIYGVGNFADDFYWSSSEDITEDGLGHDSDSQAHFINFTTGAQYWDNKSGTYRVRACRSFTAAIGAYDLKDIGPGGGYVFYYDGLGNYIEAHPSDQSASAAYSDVDTTEIGDTAQSVNVHGGLTNTAAIIGQIGHTASAAKLCDDLN